ncbi:hypothetical protein M404DRAFT_28036 [Pisolithus tinctorius Marx 270]|uniref:Uncharacterized protein n=1 Tax=Pisolithus tinctorius Marx 270 TaxID=870435 RepID=A0A0C3JXC4_PISTI|nr:hypothetical protein M404DRAFT_28036 [Pisolithus tinctorius Marx 270]
MPATRSSAVTFKVGPPIGAQRSKRVNPTVTSPTKAQPSHGAKAHHRVVKSQGGNQDTISETHEPMSGDGEECLLDVPLSSHTQVVTLQNSMKLDHAVALEQLQLGIISMEDIVAEQGCKKSVTPNDSEEDEQAVESMVQAEGDLVSENLVDHDGHQAVENMMDSICHDDVEHESASDSDWSADQRHNLKHKQTLREIHAGNYDTDNHPSTPPLPSPSSSEEEDGAADTEGDTDSSVTRRHREAKGKSRALANTSSEDKDGPSDTGDLPNGLEMTRMHGKPKRQHHAFCKAQALGMHTTQEAQAIADEYGKTLGSIMAAAGLTTKATHAESVWNMHQAWYAHTNPKVSAEYLSTIIKYKILNAAASVSLPDFNVLSQPHYDCALGLKPQEYRCDHNWQVLPTIILHKFEENGITQGQRNVSWKLLLDLLYVHQYTITDWPAGVPAVGLDFNVKCLNADELCALTVPFLKESMHADYHAEAPLDEEEDQAEYLVLC